MKKIEAIIRPSKLKSIQQGLKDVEIPCMTVVPASGTGLQKSYTKIYRGTQDSLYITKQNYDYMYC